jgi:hypothetical protein
MTFQPVLPLSGYTGWRFLARTMETQKQALVESAPVSRATTYFRENIAQVRTAEDLVGDRRLLEVALGAFGLEADINNRAFIRKVLEDGTIRDDAIANRLADKRYAAFSRAFGFGDLGASTSLSGFADTIIGRYEQKSFEIAVGAQNGDFRQALGLSTGLAEVIAQTTTPRAQWYAVMGNLPLRQVFETALGLPSSLGTLDIDQQLETFESRAKATFGTDKVSDFTDPAIQEKLIRLFLVRSESQAAGPFGAASVALQLLQR